MGLTSALAAMTNRPAAGASKWNQPSGSRSNSTGLPSRVVSRHTRSDDSTASDRGAAPGSRTTSSRTEKTGFSPSIVTVHSARSIHGPSGGTGGLGPWIFQLRYSA